jgi:monovalent cation/hydrogen antiporter
MQLLETLLALMLCAVALAWASRRMRIPYPIALTLGGTALGFIPHLPNLPLDPNLVLVIFLPPILYPAALLTSWRDFRRALRPIMLLAVGLVLATTLAVGVVLHYLVPEIPWSIAFAFGAIVSPPDAVAATAVLANLKLPRRIVTILEGESLVNDASGLVLYKFAVAAALTGAFSVTQAVGNFALVAIGGLLVGIAVGRLSVEIHKHLQDSLVEIMLSLAIPYTAYLAAETLHVSGVLAVVAAGLLRARYAPEVFSANTRLLGHSVWNLIVFLLNSFIFVIIGLQLRTVIASLSQYTWPHLLGLAAAVSTAAIIIRMLWVFPGAYLPHLLSSRVRGRERRPPWQQVVVVGWCGMRGIVSLAAALALPLTLTGGTPFPARDLLIFLTFAVILATLVIQGLSLAPLFKRLGIGSDWSEYEEECKARRATKHAALAQLEKVAAHHGASEAMVNELRTQYLAQLEDLNPTQLVLTDSQNHRHSLRAALLHAERRELIRLWRAHEVGDDALHSIERQLDLEEARLMRE